MKKTYPTIFYQKTLPKHSVTIIYYIVGRSISRKKKKVTQKEKLALATDSTQKVMEKNGLLFHLTYFFTYLKRLATRILGSVARNSAIAKFSRLKIGRKLKNIKKCANAPYIVVAKKHYLHVLNRSRVHRNIYFPCKCLQFINNDLKIEQRS